MGSLSFSVSIFGCTSRFIGPLMQRVHNVRKHFKLFIAQELQIIQIPYTVILKRNSESVYVLPMRVILSFTDSQR
jgi:hypothetical protein